MECAHTMFYSIVLYSGTKIKVLMDQTWDLAPCADYEINSLLIHVHGEFFDAGVCYQWLSPI